MRWARKSLYCITSGAYTVSKAHILDAIKYAAWRQQEPLGVFTEPEDAKRACAVDEKMRKNDERIAEG